MCPYAAAQLIGKVKNATPGMVIALYGVMRLVSAAFNVSFWWRGRVRASGHYADGGGCD